MTGATELDEAGQHGSPGIVRSTAELGVTAPDAVRLRFEAWMDGLQFNLRRRSDRPHQYANASVQGRWVTWQAAQVENVRLRAALEVVVADWTQQFERAGHMAPGWVKQAREALTPNVANNRPAAFGGSG